MNEPLPAPSVLLATLQSETLIPKRTSRSCETFSGQDEELEQGEICISNICGFGEAVVLVDTPLAGDVGVSSGVLRYSLGEWCEPEFPLSRDLLLVAVDAYDAGTGEHDFRYERTFQTEDGQHYFVPELITEIEGIELRVLAKPLKEPLVYGATADSSPSEIEHLLSLGFVKVVDDTLVADTAVYVTDLIDALGDR